MSLILEGSLSLLGLLFSIIRHKFYKGTQSLQRTRSLGALWAPTSRWRTSLDHVPFVMIMNVFHFNSGWMINYGSSHLVTSGWMTYSFIAQSALLMGKCDGQKC